jgi:fused signal recognition particle receptor
MAFFSKLKERLFKSSSKLEEGLEAIVEDGRAQESTPTVPPPVPEVPAPAPQEAPVAPAPQEVPQPPSERDSR